jgi:hypothetical protein
LHSNVDPLSLEEKLKLAPVAFVGSAGLESIVVSGSVRSIVHVYAAGVGSVLFSGSIARTSKVCDPADSPV